MSGTDCQDKQQSQQPWISDPRLGLGLVPGGSKIEIKWRIQAENGDEMDLVRDEEFFPILNSVFVTDQTFRGSDGCIPR